MIMVKWSQYLEDHKLYILYQLFQLSESTIEFYVRQSEPIRTCLLALQQLILAQDSKISETTKYGMPCFTYNKKPFCYLWIDKKSTLPYILFVEGKHLEDPHLEQGTRARMKIFRIDPAKNIPVRKISTLIRMALELYTSGRIKI